MANFIYVRQKGPYGNATPVLNASHLIGDEPFAVLFGDDIYTGKKPRLRQMLDVFEKYGDPVISAIQVSKADVSRYGIVEATKIEDSVYQIKKLIHLNFNKNRYNASYQILNRRTDEKNHSYTTYAFCSST